MSPSLNDDAENAPEEAGPPVIWRLVAVVEWVLAVLPVPDSGVAAIGDDENTSEVLVTSAATSDRLERVGALLLCDISSTMAVPLVLVVLLMRVRTATVDFAVECCRDSKDGALVSLQ